VVAGNEMVVVSKNVGKSLSPRKYRYTVTVQFLATLIAGFTCNRNRRIH